MERSVEPERITNKQVIESPQTKLVLDETFVGKLPAGSTAPSVINVEHWITQNVGAVTITRFNNGQDGQSLFIVGDGQTTLKQSTGATENIFLVTGADTLLAVDRIYHLKYISGKWYQP